MQYALYFKKPKDISYHNNLDISGFISYLDEAFTDKRSYLTYYVRTIYIYILTSDSAVVLLRH